MPLQSRPYLPEPVNLNHPLARGLVAWWLVVPGLDGGSNWYDLVGQNHGALTNMTTSGGGWRGTTRPGGLGHVLFDGSNDYVAISPVSGEHTFTAWAFPLVVTGTHTVFDLSLQPVLSGDWDALGIQSSKIYTYAGSYFTGNTTLSPNAWVHLAVTLSNGNGVLYVNGVPDGTFTGASSWDSFSWHSASLGAARTTATPSQVWSGNLDDVRVYSRALSASEVGECYNNSRCGYPGLLNQTRATYQFWPNTYTEVMSGGAGTAGSAIVSTAYNEPLFQQVFLSMRSKRLYPSSPASRPYLPEPVNLNHPLAQGLVSWWLALPGLDGGQKWYDVIGGYHGTLTNMTTSASGWRSTTRPGGWRHLLFDGVNDNISTAARVPVASFSTGSTYIAWAQTTSTASSRGYGGDPSMPILGDTTANVWIGWGVTGGVQNFMYAGTGPFATGTVAVNDGAWHFLAVVHDRTTGNIQLYTDGIADGSGTSAWNGIFPAVNSIGRGFSSSDLWNGFLDDVRIYSRALSAAEIFDLYANSRTGYPGLLNQRYSGPTLSYGPSVLYAGVSLGGSAVAQQIENQTNSGAGVLDSGSAPRLVTHSPPVASGGTWLSGSATVVVSYNDAIGSAGFWLSGFADNEATYNVGMADAGLWQAGFGNTTAFYSPAGVLAGVMAAGAVINTDNDSEIASGGAILGTSTEAEAQYNVLMDGGMYADADEALVVFKPAFRVYTKFKVGDIVFAPTAFYDRFLQYKVLAIATFNTQVTYQVGVGWFQEVELMSCEEYRAWRCRKAEFITRSLQCPVT